jgi:hypothetical protein
MPVFISYSHKDKQFADTLARNLIHQRHHVWMDRWELKVGDSLLEKIQNALGGANAIIVILSKHSVDSVWCKKELNAGLMRELEEKNTIILPCVIDDCEIPIFLKEKLYADFRKNPDDAFIELDKALAGISNPHQGRTETPDFLIDWSTSWGTLGDDLSRQVIEHTYVDHSPDWPYIVMAQCRVICNSVASRQFSRDQEEGQRSEFILAVLDLILEQTTKKELTMTIDSALPQRLFKKIMGKKGADFLVEFSCRRLGLDNGMDTIYYFDKNLIRTVEHMRNVLSRPGAKH